MNEAVLARALQKFDAHKNLRAAQAQDIAADNHENAPRGGRNLNRNFEPRSAPGETPAPETGNLLDEMRGGPYLVGDIARVVLNYKKLEFGYLSDEGYVAPRPGGQIATEEFKAAVRGGQLPSL